VSLDADLRARKVRGLETGHPLLAASGLRVLEFDRGYASVRMPIEVNANHIGTFYAGSLAVLAEVAGAALFSASFDSKRFYPIVKDMRVRFLRPATRDVVAVASLEEDAIDMLERRAESEGKVDVPLDVELRDEEGVVVARAESVFQLRARPPKPERA
jgi:uncharacterized protein (TIGR00369 family)